MPIRWYGPSLILLGTVVAVMLLGPGMARKIVWSHTDAQITQVRQGLTEQPGLASLSAAFSEVSRVVEPSVVHVKTLGPSPRSGGGFFSRFDPLTPLGNGSGWVYAHQRRPDAEVENYILTNHHVVADAEEVRVRFADGSEHVAAVVGSDPLTDVAVLRVNDPFLHAAAVSPEPVRKGQIVFAFGSPFRFDFSVSQGIVSASGRQLDLMNRGKYEDFIQTDAAINPGNSGGPLTDIYGQVVGMNTAIASSRTQNPRDPGGFMGLGFAIPVEMAVDVATRLIEEGEVRRGYLGVYIRDLGPAMAASFGFEPGTEGVLVEHAFGGGPGAAAGLEPGDLVTHVEGQSVADVGDLRYRVAAFSPGTSVELTVRRGQAVRGVRVTLDELEPGNPGIRASLVPPPLRFTPRRTFQVPLLRALGIERLADFDAEDAARVGRPELTGVVVIDTRLGSVADAQRVEPQAIVTHLDGEPIADGESLRRALDGRPASDPVRLTTRFWDARLGEYVTRFALLQPRGG
ncbi:MAG: trypsin-like peptidase domain-containing protein [Planctomycetota bacterium]